MSAPLTNHQKAYLAQLAARAQNRLAALARGCEPHGPMAADACVLTPEAWRHSEVARACGKAGLRCCSQDDFKRVEAHFLHLLGEDGRALNAHVQAETEPRRVAEWKLVQACQEFGFHLAYAEAICRRQHHGAGLGEVGVKAIWQLVYTVRNRGRAKLKLGKQKAETEAQHA
jgi:hypothetical protein